MNAEVRNSGGGALSKAPPEGRGNVSKYLHNFLTFLTSRPEPDEICNHIVMAWPNADVMQQSAIGHITSEGMMTFPGRFGYEAKVLKIYGTTTIWDDIPSAVAVRERRIVVCNTREAVVREYPHVAEAMPGLAAVIAAPLISNHTPLGACVVSANQPLLNEQDSANILSHYALALSLYFASMRSGNTDNGASNPHPSNNASSEPFNNSSANQFPRRQTLAPNQLTDRQLRVLELMAENFTNRQIAMRMGFSESTIRQETMALYAYFGVPGRHDAVDAARMRGMISPISDDDEDALVNE